LNLRRDSIEIVCVREIATQRPVGGQAGCVPGGREKIPSEASSILAERSFQQRVTGVSSSEGPWESLESSRLRGAETLRNLVWRKSLVKQLSTTPVDTRGKPRPVSPPQRANPPDTLERACGAGTPGEISLCCCPTVTAPARQGHGDANPSGPPPRTMPADISTHAATEASFLAHAPTANAESQRRVE
jgi:hypothetical protein